MGVVLLAKISWFTKAKRNWRILVEIVGIIGGISTLVALWLAYLQLSQQQQQFIIQQSQKPKIEYSTYVSLSSVDQKTILAMAKELLDKYYKLLNQKAQSNPKDYASAIVENLPISIKVPAKPISIVIKVENNGFATASKVRVNAKTEHVIDTINITTQEPYQIIKGGIGDKDVTVEIDRIVPNDTAKIELVLAKTDLTDQSDSLTLTADSLFPGFILGDVDSKDFVNAIGDHIHYERVKDGSFIKTINSNGRVLEIKYSSEGKVASVSISGEESLTLDSDSIYITIPTDQGKGTIDVDRITDLLYAQLDNNKTTQLSVFPKLEYKPDQNSKISLTVTSNEGFGTEVHNPFGGGGASEDSGSSDPF